MTAASMCRSRWWRQIPPYRSARPHRGHPVPHRACPGWKARTGNLRADEYPDRPRNGYGPYLAPAFSRPGTPDARVKRHVTCALASSPRSTLPALTRPGFHPHRARSSAPFCGIAETRQKCDITGSIRSFRPCRRNDNKSISLGRRLWSCRSRGGGPRKVMFVVQHVSGQEAAS